VAILDDLIASGSTVVTAAAQLRAQGAKAVFAACTHGLFTNGAVQRLRSGGVDRVLCTDTTAPAPGCEVVSAAPAVARLLLRPTS
jgi:ribose-phosphate pyrophosphokinase